jgi:Ran GTPase-activating protein (RanGAP) involved in mRNA processing and transport
MPNLDLGILMPCGESRRPATRSLSLLAKRRPYKARAGWRTDPTKLTQKFVSSPSKLVGSRCKDPKGVSQILSEGVTSSSNLVGLVDDLTQLSAAVSLSKLSSSLHHKATTRYKMSSWLSHSSLMAPVPPAWLDSLCQRLVDNDPSLVTIELANTQRLDDVYSKIFSHALEQNYTCTTLIISFFAMVDDGAFSIASVLAKNRHIQRLQIRDLRSHREVTILLGNMGINKTITELSFRHCQLCPMSAKAIESYLQSSSSIQEVRMVDCQLLHDAESSMERLSSGFRHCQSLRKLYLLNMELEAASAKHLAHMLAHEVCALEELHLGENNLGDEGVAILCEGVLTNQSLRLLDLRSNSLTEQAALSIQGIVAQAHFLQALCLCQNELGPAGAAALARGLQQSSATMKRLSLSENFIGTEGSNSMARILRVNKSLQELDLSVNGICSDGAAIMAKALTKNKTLRSINLRRNLISDKGALAFADNLVDMGGLRELKIDKNAIGAVGIAAFLAALQRNTEIEYISIGEDSSMNREMLHLFRLNQAGRRIFKHDNVPSCLWPKIYGRISDKADNLYYFVQARPETTEKRSQERTERQISNFNECIRIS